MNKKFIDNSLNYCILASDGAWDSLNLDDISKITFENKNDFDNSYTNSSEDNISCIVVDLKKKIY